MSPEYVPDEGDVVWLQFNPQKGHEQAGHRPAVVLTKKQYNGKTGLLVCVPVTNQAKGYPFEVALSDKKVTGVALSDQVKSLDWKARNATKKGSTTQAEMREIRAKLKVLVGIR